MPASQVVFRLDSVGGRSQLEARKFSMKSAGNEPDKSDHVYTKLRPEKATNHVGSLLCSGTIGYFESPLRFNAYI